MISILILVYCYAVYPFLISVRARMEGTATKADPAFRPRVTVLVAAFNEEKVLRRALTALLEIDYPENLLEFFVGSDGSSDATNAIIAEFEVRSPLFRPFIFQERRGKIPVMNDMAARASGDVLLFTDADVAFSPDVCLKIVRHFADPTVGGVTGLITLDGDHFSGPLGAERGYLASETLLRWNESRLGSTVGIHGGDYALRRELWRPLPHAPICDELYAALRVISSGYRMVFDPSARATENFGRSMKDEYARRKRFATRGFITLQAFPGLLDPSAGLPALMLWSHKVFRWLSPIFLFLFFIGSLSSASTEGSFLGTIVCIIEAMIVLGIAVGYVGEYFGKPLPIASSLYWFFIMNIAFLVGTTKFFFRSESEFWDQPTRSETLESKLKQYSTYQKEVPS